MNNREWLYSLDVADLSDWFDAEHIENQERALDGDTDALERKSADLIHEYYKPMVAEMQAKMDRLTAERDELKGQVFTLKGECEDLESERDKLQEQLRIGWECECRLQAELDKFKEANDYHAAQYELASEDCDRLQTQVDELKAERDKLQEQLMSQICKLEDDLVRTSDERDNWKANCEDWKNHARAAENACYETMLEREAYRRKFGKCLDYADAIHALMDDEGMA